MKKIVFSLAVSTCLFQPVEASTFSDVPRNHWAYQAIEQVSASGIIKGYAEKFHGEEKVSRYEMATIVSRLLDSVSKNKLKLSPDVNSSMQRLVDEFSNELAFLGARVDSLEAKSAEHETRIEKLETTGSTGNKIGNVNVSGSIGIRHQSLFNDGVSDNTDSDLQFQTFLNLSGKVNDKTKWGFQLRTGVDDYPSVSWRNVGSNDDRGNNFSGFGMGTDDFVIDRLFIDHKINDEFRVILGKGENLFRSTELVFDNDFSPTGFTQEYKINKDWTVRAGQFFLKEGNSPAGAKSAKEDSMMFAHQVEYNRKNKWSGDWTVKASNFNFTGEQFLHPGQGVTASRFVGLNSRTTNFAAPYYGNYYNQIINGATPTFPGVTTNTVNATNAGRQNRLFSDFNLANVFVHYHNDNKGRTPWGVKLDYVVNNSAWNSEDTGYWFEVYQGDLKEKGDVKYGYSYRRVETDATIAWLNAGELGTNIKGHSVYYMTKLADSVTWFTTFFLFEPENSFGVANVDQQGRLRTGLTLSF